MYTHTKNTHKPTQTHIYKTTPTHSQQQNIQNIKATTKQTHTQTPLQHIHNIQKQSC